MNGCGCRREQPTGSVRQVAGGNTVYQTYGTLLLDVMRGDATPFKRADQSEASWVAVMPIVEAWQQVEPADFPNYDAGSWEPDDPWARAGGRVYSTAMAVLAMR